LKIKEILFKYFKIVEEFGRWWDMSGIKRENLFSCACSYGCCLFESWFAVPGRFNFIREFFVYPQFALRIAVKSPQRGAGRGRQRQGEDLQRKA
jgi:hypothetical protein